MVLVQQQRSTHQIKQPGPPTHPAVLSQVSACLSSELGWALIWLERKKNKNRKKVFHPDQFARLIPRAAAQTAGPGQGLVQRGMKKESSSTATQQQFI